MAKDGNLDNAGILRCSGTQHGESSIWMEVMNSLVRQEITVAESSEYVTCSVGAFREG